MRSIRPYFGQIWPKLGQHQLACGHISPAGAWKLLQTCSNERPPSGMGKQYHTSLAEYPIQRRSPVPALMYRISPHGDVRGSVSMWRNAPHCGACGWRSGGATRSWGIPRSCSGITPHCGVFHNVGSTQPSTGKSTTQPLRRSLVVSGSAVGCHRAMAATDARSPKVPGRPEVREAPEAPEAGGGESRRAFCFTRGRRRNTLHGDGRSPAWRGVGSCRFPEARNNNFGEALHKRRAR